MPDGKNFGGADALIEISRRFWWAWPFHEMGRVPAVKLLLRRAYHWIALRRHCLGGTCRMGRAGNGTNTFRLSDLLPLLFLPLLALLYLNQCAAWIFMWIMALALYAGCKWLTFRQAVRGGAGAGWRRALGYLLAWPGMDAAKFLSAKSVPEKPRGTEWTLALANTAFGFILFWVVARKALPAHPMIGGWIAMAGVVFILHFGLFHVLSLVWRGAGVTATPLMENPVLACSLREFWGRRWNTAFNELAFRFAFRPLCRVVTPTLANVLVFGLSGLVHELVISLPARGGYGLPTAYFLVQGIGLSAQRTNFSKKIGFGDGLGGWFFTMLVTAGLACWLFHPRFITLVILPMLSQLGAT